MRERERERGMNSMSGRCRLISSKKRKLHSCTSSLKSGCTAFGPGCSFQRYHLVHPGVHGRIILRRIFRKWDEGLDGTDLVQDRDR